MMRHDHDHARRCSGRPVARQIPRPHPRPLTPSNPPGRELPEGRDHRLWSQVDDYLQFVLSASEDQLRASGIYQHAFLSRLRAVAWFVAPTASDAVPCPPVVAELAEALGWVDRDGTHASRALLLFVLVGGFCAAALHDAPPTA